MPSIDDLQGFCYPLTPDGRSSLVGDMPWHYATEYLTIAYRADPAAIAAYLPAPLEPGPEPDMAYVAFSRWWSVWDGDRELAVTNPERTQYQEAAIWVNCSYRGEPGQICLQIWVSNDFTMARGWFMGFAKKLGQVHITDTHPLNPVQSAFGPGERAKGYVVAHGERLIEGTMTAERRIAREELPAPMGRPLFHIRHFPSIVRGAKPSVLELVRLGAENVRFGDDIWAGTGELTFLPSDLEEHMPLAPREIVGAYRFSSGYTFPGGEVLHSWV
ncbi:MAG: acetoacetate decarboxylase [Actinobacteria bacterium]|nr:acetoacetate decarboxylase [Actinomycetota bacterium]